MFQSSLIAKRSFSHRHESSHSVEPLEARIAPAAFVWDGSAGNGDWFTPSNWTPDGVPGSGDEATLNINSTINLPSAASVGAFKQTAGTFTGAGTLTVSGELVWTGGTMSGSGVTTAAGGMSLAGATKTLNARTLNNAGVALWTSGDISAWNGAVFNNQEGASFETRFNGSFSHAFGAMPSFNNAGDFIKSRGATWAGNGHFYEVALASLDWISAQDAAIAAGGYLATLTSAEENAFVFSLVDNEAYWTSVGSFSSGPWLGGFQPSGSPEPAGGWRWVNGEGLFVFSNWATGQPNNAGTGGENRLQFFTPGGGRAATWNDTRNFNAAEVVAYVIERDSVTELQANAGATRIGVAFNNTGAVDIRVGATLDLQESFVQAAGNTALSGGGLRTTLPLNIAGGELTGAGTLTGSVTNSGGTVRPGDPLGVLTITGNYTQGPGANLHVELGGTTVGTQYDRLSVGGTASLDGALTTSFINGFSPDSGTHFTIVTAGDRIGTFAASAGEGSLTYTPVEVQFVSGSNVLPTISISDAIVLEGNTGTTVATFTVTLSEASSQPVSVQYSTPSGTATAGSDYTTVSNQTLSFAPGETSKSINISVLGDTLVEADETFFVTLTSPASATLARAEGTGTILNDDREVLITPTGDRASFTDVDGDLISVTTSKGTFTKENSVFNEQGALVSIDLTSSGTGRSAEAGFVGFTNAAITIKAKSPKTGGGGNGFIGLSTLQATGISLGKIKIDGDLGKIEVGEGVPGKAAFKSLVANSVGVGLDAGVDNVSTINGTAGTLKIKNDVVGVLNVTGGFADDGLANSAATVVKKVVIGGNLDGSAGGERAGLLRVAGSIGSVVVKGSVIGGAEQSGIVVGGKLGSLKIGGDLRSADDAKPVTISALGDLTATKVKQAVALAKVAIGGSVLNAEVLAGYKRDGTPFNADASIGSILVAGNWSASSVAAGIADVTGDGFGRNDELIGGDTTPSLLSRIAKVTINGTMTGSSASTDDHYGVTAQQIGKVTLGKSARAFTPGPDNLLLDPLNNDFRMVDFA